MPIAVTRREMFKRGAAAPAVILPPWAKPFDDYVTLCDGCGDCISACPENILTLNDDNIAIVDFSQSSCDLCAECEIVCPAGALAKSDGQPAWLHKAEINAQCLSTQGIVCRLCEEACEPRAIQFKLMLEGRSIPLVNVDQCNGCGGCLSVCPTNAVTLKIPMNKEPQS